MFRKNVWILASLALLLSSNCFVKAAEDTADGENAEETAKKQNDNSESLQQNSKGEGNDETTPSPDAKLTFLFTTPVNNKELVAGQLVKFLVGFSNKGEKDFIVKACDTSFRYPMDFSYRIQNFSAAHYDQVVQPKQEATFDYSFIPSEVFIGRPLGLAVNLHYIDAEGAYYASAVFNETINVVEDESAFNTETGFLYVVLAGLGVLVLLIGQHLLSKFTKKQPSNYQPNQEVGTNNDEVDYEWIPRTNLVTQEKKSPRTRRPAKAH